MPVDQQETIDTKSQVPAAVARVNQVLQERADYLNAHDKWEKDKKNREDAKLEPQPEPEKPASMPLAEELDRCREEFSKAGTEAMDTWVERGVMAERNRLGYEFTAEMKVEADRNVVLGKEKLDQLISQLGDYQATGGVDAEMAKIVRADALQKAIARNSVVEGARDYVAKVYEACPEVVHVDWRIPSELVSNFKSGTLDSTLIGQEATDTFFRAMAAETSPASQDERQWAELGLNESVGVKIYGQLSRMQTAGELNEKTLGDVMGITLPEGFVKGLNGDVVRSVPMALAELSRSDTVSQADRNKLKGIVLGYVRALNVGANTMLKKDPYGRIEGYTEAGLARKNIGAEIMLALIDQKNESFIRDYINAVPSDVIRAEMQHIYTDSRLRLQTVGNSRIIMTQNAEVLEKERAEGEVKRQAELKLRQEREATEAKAKQRKENETVLAAVAGFDQVLNKILAKGVTFDYSLGQPSTQLKEQLVQMVSGGELTQEQYAFAREVLERFDTIFQYQSDGLTSMQQRTIVDSNGVFGIGRKTHEEPYQAANYGEVDRRVKDLEGKRNPEVVVKKDEVEILALKLFKRMPTTGQ